MAKPIAKRDGAVVKAKSSPAPKPGIVVIPARPDTKAAASIALPPVAGKKHPLAAKEHPDARATSGKPGRTDIRKEAPRVSAPRASAKPAERGGQHRSNKAGK